MLPFGREEFVRTSVALRARHAVDGWRETGGKADVLDLASLRAAHPGASAKRPHARSDTAEAHSAAGREVKAMLLSGPSGLQSIVGRARPRVPAHAVERCRTRA